MFNSHNLRHSSRTYPELHVGAPQQAPGLQPPPASHHGLMQLSHSSGALSGA